MKKLKLTLLLLFAISATVSAQQKKDNQELGWWSPHVDNYEHLNGDVKEVHYKPYHTINEDGVLKNGKPIKFLESGYVKLRQPWSYYFNEAGELVKTTINYDGKSDWTGVVHKDNGKIKNIYWLHGDTLKLNWEYIYPGKRKVIRNWKLIKDDEITGKRVFYLDKKGNIIKREIYNDKGEKTYTHEYTRDADGTMKSKSGINQEGKILWGRDKHTYNKKGLLETVHLNVFRGEPADHSNPKIVYEYDEKGNWVKRKAVNAIVERDIVYYD